MTTKSDQSRRALLKKAAYVAPAILTLQAYSAAAKAGSAGDYQEQDFGKKRKRKPKRK